MDIAVSMVAFFALIASWFVLPASPRTVKTTAPASAEGFRQAA